MESRRKPSRFGAKKDEIIWTVGGHRAAWALEMLAARALARVAKRYPSTLVGKGNRYYDVLGTDGASWDVRETAAPWTDRSPK